MLLECSAESSSRADLLLKLKEKIENGFERFDALDSLGKSPFILGSKLWKEHFDSLSYDVDSSQSQSSTGDLGDFIGIEGQSGKICVREVSLTLVSFTHLVMV